MFTEGEAKLKTSFLKLKSKRLLSKSSLYTFKNQEGSKIDIEDELIKDPRFAALLNEEREIIIGNNIYVFTTKGMFYSKLEHEDDLRTYLSTLEGKMANGKYMELEPCLTDEPIAPNVYQSTYCGGGGGGGTPLPHKNNGAFRCCYGLILSFWLIGWVYYNTKWNMILSPLKYAGRMALTNYIMQSFIGLILFSSIGFKLYETLSPSGTLLTAITVFIFQIIFSKIWLKYFRFGPLEWVWTCLTYKELLPMKKDTVPYIG